MIVINRSQSAQKRAEVVDQKAFRGVGEGLVESRAAQHEPRKKKLKTEACTCKTLFVVIG